MIGMYITENQGRIEQNKDKTINTKEFVPFNEFSEELELDSHAHGYVIMPATYDV